MPGNRPPRLRNFTYVGLHRYHVRVCTWHRRRYFTEDALAASVREQLLQFANVCGFAIPAYCIMYDHVHLLAEATTATADLMQFIAGWKQRTAFVFRSVRCECLWQPGFFDRVLREQESSRVVARYIVENPVRAGLATVANQYPYAYCEWSDDPCFWD